MKTLENTVWNTMFSSRKPTADSLNVLNHGLTWRVLSPDCYRIAWKHAQAYRAAWLWDKLFPP